MLNQSPMQQWVKAHGPVSFERFMHHALYSNIGYYQSQDVKIGVRGDFVTAPELTPLFGACIAQQCIEVMKQCQAPEILEFGAGNGSLLVSLLKNLESLDSLPVKYHIVEVSHDLRQRQRLLIDKHIPHLKDIIYWHDGFFEPSFEGVMIANEVLDAMPVHRFCMKEGQALESFIAADDNNGFIETFHPIANQRLAQAITKLPIKAFNDYYSEVNLYVAGWLKSCASLLNKGLFLLIDYGFPRHEYYHMDRGMGTLMCHRQQLTHPDFLKAPGFEDISAHVDFTAVAESALSAGFHVCGYTNQASFLLANQMLEKLAALPEQDRLKQTAQVKLLLQEHEMGELFKVLGLTKEIDKPLTGFSFHDRRASL